MVARQELGFSPGEVEHAVRRVAELVVQDGKTEHYSREYVLDDQPRYVVEIGSHPLLIREVTPEEYEPEHFGVDVEILSPELTGSDYPVKFVELRATPNKLQGRIDIWHCQVLHWLNPGELVVLEYEPIEGASGIVELHEVRLDTKDRFGDSVRDSLDVDQLEFWVGDTYPVRVDAASTILRYVFDTRIYGGKQRLTAAEIQRRPLIPAKL